MSHRTGASPYTTLLVASPTTSKRSSVEDNAQQYARLPFRTGLSKQPSTNAQQCRRLPSGVAVTESVDGRWSSVVSLRIVDDDASGKTSTTLTLRSARVRRLAACRLPVIQGGSINSESSTGCRNSDDLHVSY